MNFHHEQQCIVFVCIFFHYRYVSDVLGGSVERSGPLGYELPAGYIQLDQNSNLVPVGQLKLGAFQQRTLLFKVSTFCTAHHVIRINFVRKNFCVRNFHVIILYQMCAITYSLYVII